MRSKTRSRGAKTPPARTGRRFPVALVAGGFGAAALAATVLLTMGSTNQEPLEIGVPAVTGAPLPRLIDESVVDPALGLPAPEVTGTDFSGETVTITADGRAKIIVFLAHWCPSCQAEVPLLVEWLETEPLPESIDLYSVSVFVARNQDNYPPSEWLAREGWTVPVILDDETDSVTGYFGLDRTPSWVFINAEGAVVDRLTGGLNAEDLDAIVANLADS